MLETAIDRLTRYIEAEDFRGYDPYDALNSPILNLLGRSSKWVRIAFTQTLRRCPINLRPLLAVAKDHNPKGMGLFLSAYLNQYRLTDDKSALGKAKLLIAWLKEHTSEGYSEWCWGYNFDWQSRAVFQPKYTPTGVATSFVANAFLDAYETLGHEEYLQIARQSCDFIRNHLNTRSGPIWSYSPRDDLQVYNATMLGVRLFARVYRFTQEVELLKEAERKLEFVMSNQNDDGSWVYGQLDYQGWIDSFHTGYNLECLYEFMKFSGIDRYDRHLKRGLEFYRTNFFLEDMTPKYYHDRIYPIDIHSPAQAIVCFSKLGDVELAQQIADWAIENMQSPNGYFYFRKHRLYTNKIPYIRWSQAWMLYALTTLAFQKAEHLPDAGHAQH